MILNIIIKKVLPILTLGIGFSFAIIVGFSNVEIIPLHITYTAKWTTMAPNGNYLYSLLSLCSSIC
mgnify:CR=1 FL=1